MANVIADFLIDRVKANGWISVGNIMFEDGCPCINPISSVGNICLSPSKQLIFSLVRMDTHMSYAIEEGYLAIDYRNHGVQQTLVCEPFDRLRQFDILLMTPTVRKDEAGEKYIPTTYPSVSTVEGLVLDPETGLGDPSKVDDVTMINGVTASAINLFPDITNIRDYVGIRVKEYQEFIKTQKMFCQLVKDMTGISDLM